METYDWSRFTVRIPIATDVKRIYELLSTQNGLETWFLRLAQFTDINNIPRESGTEIEKGDRYQWRWHGYPDEVEEKGSIINANGKDQIQFSFAGDCVVTISVKQNEGISIVEITQENIPTDEDSKVKFHLGCNQGWSFYLANLKSICEGGRDLRNRDIKLQGVLNS